MNTLIELMKFLKSRKKLWLAPLMLLLIMIGSLLIAAEGSILAPFIYTIF